MFYKTVHISYLIYSDPALQSESYSVLMKFLVSTLHILSQPTSSITGTAMLLTFFINCYAISFFILSGYEKYGPKQTLKTKSS